MLEIIGYLEFILWILIAVFIMVGTLRSLDRAKIQLWNNSKSFEELNNVHKNDLDKLRNEFEQRYQKTIKVEEERYNNCKSKLDEILRRLEK